MSLNQYARHRGVYPRAVETAIKAARITRDEYGLIDSEKADRDWLANTPPERTAMAKEKGRQTQAQKRKLGASAPQGTSAAAEGRSSETGAAATDPGGPAREATDIANYQRDRAEREKYNALNARLTYEIRLNRYVPRAEWEAAATAFWGQLREALLAIPVRLADELAVADTAAAVRTMLDREIRDTLERALAENEQRRKAEAS